MNLNPRPAKPSLRDELREWLHGTPRVWWIIGLIALAAFIAGVVVTALFVMLVLVY